MLIKTFVNTYKQAFNVTTVGFEPTRPCEHQPLKLASLPFLHVAYKPKKSSRYARHFSDPTGARTQDPIIKSDVLYRLSYRVIFSYLERGCKYKALLFIFQSYFILNLPFFTIYC